MQKNMIQIPKSYYVKLNEKQLEKLSDIAVDVGSISLASVVLPALLDKFNILVLLCGTVATIFFWIFSIWIRR